MIIVSKDVTTDGARWLADHLAAAVAARGAATIALSGGKSPAPMHRALAGLTVPWAQVTVYFGDERAVPPEHAESNYGMARASLLERVQPAAVHRMEAESSDVEEAARRYAALLPETLDIVVLGIGTDGHTASLFPGTDWSQPTHKRVLCTTAPVAPYGRMTLSPEIIMGARDVLVIATGSGKAQAVAAALEAPYEPARTPAQIVRGRTWLLDRAAAAQLENKG